jgi:hypothetical protein
MSSNASYQHKPNGTNCTRCCRGTGSLRACRQQSVRLSRQAPRGVAATLTRNRSQKKAALKALNDCPEFTKSNAGKKNEAYATAAGKISDRFAAQAEELRYQLVEEYEERRRTDLPDYPIFMAIAEDIGYDATGRPTRTNELEPIAAELARFVITIDEGKP